MRAAVTGHDAWHLHASTIAYSGGWLQTNNTRSLLVGWHTPERWVFTVCRLLFDRKPGPGLGLQPSWAPGVQLLSSAPISISKVITIHTGIYSRALDKSGRRRSASSAAYILLRRSEVQEVWGSPVRSAAGTDCAL